MCMKPTLALREEHTVELNGYRCLREVLNVAEISEQVRIVHKYVFGSPYL